MTLPLVSVICMCYQHKKYVREAVHSVKTQSHPNIQLIIVDDGSTDGGRNVIQQLSNEYDDIETLLLSKNLGYCKAFNRALSLVKGEYIIDLAADDVLLAKRIEKGLQSLASSGPDFGVTFSDAEWIDSRGNHLYYQSDRFPHHAIPQGDIYIDLIRRYFICPPTVMFRRSVIDFLGGYDENLAYEDFDFWIRSSRKYKYCYLPEVLVKKRVLKTSMSEKQFRRFSPQQHSTYEVCKKIMLLNKTHAEKHALSGRILYELVQALRLADLPLTFRYAKLWFKNLMATH